MTFQIGNNMTKFTPVIIAQADTLFLALVDGDIGRIIDTENKIVGPKLDVMVILCNGIWTPIENRLDVLKLSHTYTWQKIPEQVTSNS